MTRTTELLTVADGVIKSASMKTGDNLLGRIAVKLTQWIWEKFRREPRASNVAPETSNL